MRNLDPRAVPQVDRPISEKHLSSVGNFFGLYGGEHIAATEFVIGATLVTWGCSALTIILGLIIGNLLAMLSFTVFTATGYIYPLDAVQLLKENSRSICTEIL